MSTKTLAEIDRAASLPHNVHLSNGRVREYVISQLWGVERPISVRIVHFPGSTSVYPITHSRFLQVWADSAV